MYRAHNVHVKAHTVEIMYLYMYYICSESTQIPYSGRRWQALNLGKTVFILELAKFKSAILNSKNQKPCQRGLVHPQAPLNWGQAIYMLL